jgi:diguanylate cyclase (GGDEF)-like protein
MRSPAPHRRDGPPGRHIPGGLIVLLISLVLGVLVVASGLVGQARPIAASLAGVEFDELLVYVAMVLGGYAAHSGHRHRRLAAELASRRTSEDRAHSLALRDPLTGLLNRRGMDELASRWTTGAAHRVLIVCDLDGFKAVNDTHGHQAGDLVLRSFATRLAALRFDGVTVRPIRLGGDEFVLFLSAATAIDVRGVARELLRMTGEPIAIDDVTIPITATIGVARHEPGDSIDALLRLADDAMYEARRKGVAVRFARATGKDDDVGLRRMFEHHAGAVATNDPTLYAAAVGINRFRELRQSLGHAVAGRVFRDLTLRLSANDDGAMFERLSFDVLGIVFKAPDRDAAIARIEAIRAVLEGPVDLAQGPIDVQLTVGLAGPANVSNMRMLT